jgi:hypothetical protein
MAYSNSSHGTSSSLQQSSPSAMSRLRASSSAFPPGLDLRNQYRTLQTQNNSSHAVTPRSGSFANAFSSGYASAPLAAPVDFSLPRTPGDGGLGNREFNVPQLSAPMNAPQDFSNAYQSSTRQQQQSSERDFENQGQNNGEPGGQRQVQLSPSQQQQQQARSGDDSSYLRPVEYETGQKRKRSYTMPGTFESP